MRCVVEWKREFCAYSVHGRKWALWGLVNHTEKSSESDQFPDWCAPPGHSPGGVSVSETYRDSTFLHKALPDPQGELHCLVTDNIFRDARALSHMVKNKNK